MGRLTGVRARVGVTLGYLVVGPLAAWLEARLVTSDGVPGITLTLGFALAYLLSVGSWGLPAVAVAWLSHNLFVDSADVSVALVVIALAEAAIVTVGARVIEERFARIGRVRRPRVVIEFAVLAAALLPAVLYAFKGMVIEAVGVERLAREFVAHALADSIGVLAIVPGLRIMLMRQRVHVERSNIVAVLAAASVTVVALLVATVVGGAGALESAQVVLFPVLVVAVGFGTAGYAPAITLVALGVIVPVALTGGLADVPVSVPDALAWWAALVAGLLLATVGDNRRTTLAQFQSFFLRSPTPSLTIGADDGRVMAANEAAGRLLGRPPEQLRGGRLQDFVRSSDGLMAVLSRLLSGDVEELEEDVELVDEDGVLRLVRCQAVRVSLAGPQRAVVQVQFVDLTAERTHAEQLRESNEALGDFSRRAAHDLKQPVASIAAYASTLRERGAQLDSEEVARMYERLERVAERALDQLDDTFESATSQADEAAVDLHDVVESVASMLDIHREETGAAIETDLRVPVVLADVSMLRQVLLNLLTNAMKYGSTDGRPVTVRITSQVRDGLVEIAVTDDGDGIPGEELERVFVAGERLQPERADGSGHGLTDSRRLAERAGGSLRAEPSPVGARFVLRLPVQP